MSNLPNDYNQHLGDAIPSGQNSYTYVGPKKKKNFKPWARVLSV